MAIYIISVIGSGLSSFFLGWMLGRRTGLTEEHMAIKVVANLKATILVYKATHEQQITFLSQRYTDLKIDVMKCMEENKALKQEINKLK